LNTGELENRTVLVVRRFAGKIKDLSGTGSEKGKTSGDLFAVSDEGKLNKVEMRYLSIVRGKLGLPRPSLGIVISKAGGRERGRGMMRM